MSPLNNYKHELSQRDLAFRLYHSRSIISYPGQKINIKIDPQLVSILGHLAKANAKSFWGHPDCLGIIDKPHGPKLLNTQNY